MHKNLCSKLMLITLVFLISCDLHATCLEFLSGANEKWSTHNGFTSKNLPIEDLMINGVAHLKIPNELVRDKQSAEESSSNAERIRDFLIKSLNATFPQSEIKAGESWLSLGQVNDDPVNFRLGPSVRWHYDKDERLVSQNLALFKKGQLKKFTVKATLAWPVDLFPPTLFEVPAGPLQGHWIQGTAGVMSIFIVEITRHSRDLRFGGDARSFYREEFQVTN